jgi:hypothetical protein
MPSMAFALKEQARLLLVPLSRAGVTTLQASLNVTDRSVAPPRFAPHLSMTHGGFPTGDPGVSPDRTCTGWLT